MCKTSQLVTLSAMTKAIFRTQKLKSTRSVSGCLKHNFRDIKTPNADLNKLDQNEVLAGPKTAQEAMESYTGELPDKIRKNAVMAIECLATASPEFFETATPETQKQFFADSLKFIEDRFGKENIISAVVHRDESTPHLQTLVIPLVNGKLNARELIGGSKHELSRLQTEYHSRVEHHGLERGQIKSKAHHNTIKNFYTDIEQTREKVKSHVRRSNTEKEMAVSSAEYTGKENDSLKGEVEGLKAENQGLLDKLKEVFKEIKTTAYKAFGRDLEHDRVRERGRLERGREGNISRDQGASREIRNDREPSRH